MKMFVWFATTCTPSVGMVLIDPTRIYFVDVEMRVVSKDLS